MPRLPAPVGPLGLLAAYVGAQVGAALLIGLLLAAVQAGGADGSSLLAVQLTYGLSSLVLLLAAVVAVRLSRPAVALGTLWTWPGWMAVGGGVLFGLGLKVLGDLVQAGLAQLTGPVTGNNPLVLYPQAFGRPLMVVLLFGAVAAAAPIAEETFFRGLLFGWLQARLPVVPAMLIAAALFAAGHGQIDLLPPLFVVGVGLCLLYRRSRSLWVPAAAHAVINASALALALIH